VFHKPAVLLSSGKETPTLAGPLDEAILSWSTTQKLNSLRYAPGNRSSPRVVTGKWLKIENYL